MAAGDIDRVLSDLLKKAKGAAASVASAAGNVTKPIGSALGTATDIVDSIATPICTYLNNILTKLNTTIEFLLSKLKFIRDFLRKLKDLLTYPFKRAQELLNNLSSAIDDIAKAFDYKDNVKDLVNSLKKLLDCPFIADTSIGSTIAAVIDMLKEGASYITNLIKQIKNSVVSTANSVIEKLSGVVSQTIGSVESEYKALLKSSGILSIAQKILDVQKCITNLCAAVKSTTNFIQGNIVDPLEQLGISSKENGEVTVNPDDKKSDDVHVAEEASEAANKEWELLKKKLAAFEKWIKEGMVKSWDEYLKQMGLKD